MGFGHRVYKNYDLRARIIKRVADQVFAVLPVWRCRGSRRDGIRSWPSTAPAGRRSSTRAESEAEEPMESYHLVVLGSIGRFQQILDQEPVRISEHRRVP
jgi:Citrate synthase, C-terminal domain